VVRSARPVRRSAKAAGTVFLALPIMKVMSVTELSAKPSVRLASYLPVETADLALRLRRSQPEVPGTRPPYRSTVSVTHPIFAA
jgi:hypothetical protein